MAGSAVPALVTFGKDSSCTLSLLLGLDIILTVHFFYGNKIIYVNTPLILPDKGPGTQ